jgi:hypothetical protein
MPPDDAYTAGLAEIGRIRARLAELEQLAAKGPRAGLEDALADAMGRPQPTRAERDLTNAAHGWSPDDQMEQTLRQKAADPAGWSRAMRDMHASEMEVSLYERGKAASLTLAALDPKEGTE